MLDTFKRLYALLSYTRQRQMLWLVVGMFVMGLVELGLAGAISLLGVALSSPDSLEKIGVLQKLYQLLPEEGMLVSQGIRMLILVMALVCVATLLKNLLTAGMTYWQSVVSQRAAWDLCVRIFENYLNAPYVWHVERNPAELDGYLNWRAHVANFLLGGLQLVSQVAIMCFLMAGAFVLAPMVSLLLYGVTSCVALLVYKGSQRKAHKTGEELGQLAIETGKVALSALQGIREVQIYNQQHAFQRHFSSFAYPTIKAQALSNLFPAIPQWFLETVGMCLLFGAIILMSVKGESVAVITGTLTLMAAVSWRLLPALNKVVGSVLQVKSNISPVQILLADHLKDQIMNNKIEHLTLSHSLELRNVGFHYPQAKKDALLNVDVTIPKGGMVGIIGLSGAGKSTLVGVLTGLLTPQTGTVLLDGRAVNPMPGFLKIGYVSQHPYVIDASLAENVAFCDWGQAPNEERVLQCCRMAAMDFLDDLPQGIHTCLGERGMRLSGGQMQRVAIARALYGEPDILLFDEATSALDGAAESAIQHTIQTLHKDLTIVAVAHRLSTIEGCDTLYWLDNGTVRQHGSPAALLREYEQFLHDQESTSQSDTSVNAAMENCR